MEKMYQIFAFTDSKNFDKIYDQALLMEIFQ